MRRLQLHRFNSDLSYEKLNNRNYGIRRSSRGVSHRPDEF